MKTKTESTRHRSADGPSARINGVGAGSRGRALCAPLVWAAHAAFSLLELMVSVAILAIIIVGLLAMFNQVHRAFRSGTTQVDVMEGGRAASSVLVRELQELAAVPVTNGVNLFSIDQVGTMPVVQPLVAGGQRENKLMDLSFMTRVNDEWTAVAYRVANTNVTGSANFGVGTLYRLVATVDAGNNSSDLIGPTKIVLLSSNLVLSSPMNNTFDLATGLAGQCARTNYHRVIDGVVHFVVTAYDTNGMEMADAYYPTPNQANNAIGFACSNNVVPAYLEFELGVLEPAALAKFNARIPSAPGEPTVALEYLKKNAGKVHLFRQRVAIRPAAVTLAPGT